MSLVLIGLIVIAVGCTPSNEKAGKPPATIQDTGPVVSAPGAPTSAVAAEQPAPTSPTALRLAPETTKIEFYGSKVTRQSHTGGFKKFSGTIDLPGGNLSAGRINVDIDVD